MIQGVKAQAAKDAAAVATAPPIVNAYVKQLDDLRALRASLTSAQLREQAREGHISKSRNSGAGSPYDTMMRQAAETFDWGAIEALMR